MRFHFGLTGGRRARVALPLLVAHVSPHLIGEFFVLRQPLRASGAPSLVLPLPDALFATTLAATGPGGVLPLIVIEFPLDLLETANSSTFAMFFALFAPQLRRISFAPSARLKHIFRLPIATPLALTSLSVACQLLLTGFAVFFAIFAFPLRPGKFLFELFDDATGAHMGGHVLGFNCSPIYMFTPEDPQ